MKYALALACLLASIPAHALTFVGTSPRQLCATATAEVIATAINVRVRIRRGLPVTFARLRVTRTSRGRTTRHLRVAEPGGTRGGMTVRFPGLPGYYRGGRYHVCLNGPRVVWVDALRPRVAPAFTFLGLPYRWFQHDVAYRVAGNDAARVVVGAALSAWMTAADLTLTVDPATATPQQGCPTSPLVMFGDPFNLIAPPSGCSGILAYGGYCGGSATTTVNGLVFHEITTAIVTIADGFEGCPWWTAANIAEVVTHEVGHTLGFGHSADSDAIMYPWAHLNGRGAVLGTDDVDGARFVYPGVTGTSSSTNTSTTQTTSSTRPASTTTTPVPPLTTTTACVKRGKWKIRCGLKAPP